MKKSSSVKIVYDGECPFCSNFVSLANLRKLGYEVTLVNAREDDNEIVRDVAKKYDLDDGMVVLIGEKVLYGSMAAHFLSTGFDIKNPVAFLYSIMLSNRLVSRCIYPLLVRGRKIYFKLLGKPLIND